MNDRELRELAENGDVESQFILGKLLYESAPSELNEVIDPDLEESLYWFTKAAQAGHIKAQGNLGMMNLKGVGTVQNLHEGFHWLSKVADSGHTKSKYHVGSMLLTGKGVVKNISKGLALLLEAANEGDVEAQMIIGSAYFEGKDVDRNFEEALYWLKKASLNGEANAQYNLGLLYMQHPNSLVRDYRIAYKWLYSSKINDANFSNHADTALRMLSEYLTEDEIRSVKADIMDN
jgi:TPR repeat protein